VLLLCSASDNKVATAMKITIAEYGGTSREDVGIASLLEMVYVQEGFTDRAIADRIFSAAEVCKRGVVMLATYPQGDAVGMIICGSPLNPYRQIAESREAEMQLLAVHPAVRGRGLGRELCVTFENKARALGYRAAVLSTQPGMASAHRLYEGLGYRRAPARDWVRGHRRFLVYEKALGTAVI
jgi:ribosomal protein S18 acetylase RimI-like enzyme